LQTSTLAIGLATAAANFLKAESSQRRETVNAAKSIESETRALRKSLLAHAKGESTNISASDLRSKANSLALRATQAALTVAKGAGFAADHTVGRWAKEALFFLVWSCPQPVLDANLTELTRSDLEICSL